MIATMSAGHDMVDTAEAARRGLWVSNLPDSATEEVAVHALAQALALTRRLPQADAVVRGGHWNSDFTETPRRVSELTLGLVGFGRIARTLARIATPSSAGSSPTTRTPPTGPTAWRAPTWTR